MIAVNAVSRERAVIAESLSSVVVKHDVTSHVLLFYLLDLASCHPRQCYITLSPCMPELVLIKRPRCRRYDYF